MKKLLNFAIRMTALIGACAALGGCSPFVFLNASAPGKGFSRQADIAYGSLPRQKLDVYLPEATASRPWPVVVFFYGGGWESGQRDDYRFVGAALAARGVMTIVADYRLYPEVVFPAFVEDAALSVRWAQEHAAGVGGDPTRLFLMGHSAGAHIAAMLALNQEYLRSAGADPRALAGLIGLAGPYDFLPLKSATLKKIFGDPAPRRTQPIDFVTSDAPPALLINGSADTAVNPGNSTRLAAALLAAGRPVDHRVYPDIGHGRIIGAFSPLLARGVPVTDAVVQFVFSTPR
ncbi:MAG: alpha/beta hydrolase [Betaproteobacteria bacterium]|jgi:acetyl esterase/lipase